MNKSSLSRSISNAALMLILPGLLCLVGACQATAGGGGGGGNEENNGGNLNDNCAALAQEAGELAQETQAAGGAPSQELQCELLAINLAVIEAGCYDQATLPEGFSFEDQQAVLEQQQEMMGCT